MQYHSKIVTTNQPGIHQKLNELVTKHISTQYRKPYQSHNIYAFEQFEERLTRFQGSELILDSCCGTAMSSRTLAEKNPDALVIGIDQSFHRLNKEGVLESTPENCLLLQANCEDFWRMCVNANIRFVKHFILYPNPWPKSVHLKRRWHGHPVFPVLSDLAEATCLRSNWRLYLEEFSAAWSLLTEHSFEVNALNVGDEPLTLFEKKYAASGQVMYQLNVS